MIRIFFISVSLWLPLMSLGCNKAHRATNPSGANSYSSGELVNLSGPVEMFVFLTAIEMERTTPHLKNLIYNLPGESIVHVIEAPRHRLIGSVDIAFGVPRVKEKNARFISQISKLLDNLHSIDAEKTGCQLRVATVADTVSQLRRTEHASLVLLCGSPIFDDPEYPDLSMESGIYPSDAFIGRRQSPFNCEVKLPAETKVSWLTPDNNWSFAEHKKGVLRFHQLYFKELDAHVVKFTPDPALAFSFAEPHLSNDISSQGGQASMIDPRVETQLKKVNENREPFVIPLEKPPVSFARPGSLRHKLELAGGDPSKLSGEAIVLWLVYDSSGSMSVNIERANRTILKIGRDLPQIVKSLEIGISVHNDSGVKRFKCATIVDFEIDQGKSLDELRTFLSQIEASGGDAEMKDMLADGTTNLAAHGKGKRQFLMVAADFANLHSPGNATAVEVGKTLISEVKAWCADPHADRRVVAMYSGDEGIHKSFFKAIGRSNQNSFFSNRPDDLISDLLSAALPPGAPRIK